MCVYFSEALRCILSQTLFGLEPSEQQMKHGKCKKYVGEVETKRRSDRDGWNGQERCAFPSVFILSVYITFFLIWTDTHAHTDEIEGRREWEKRQSDLTARVLCFTAMFSVSIAYHLAPDRPPTQSGKHTYIRLSACTCFKLFKHGYICR